MKKWTLISVLSVFVIYIVGLMIKINMRIPLFITFIIAGLFVYLDPSEKTYRYANWRNPSFQDIETHKIESKSGTFKSTPLSSPFVGIVIAIMLCFAHSFFFVKDDKNNLKHNPDFYVEYIYNYDTIEINVDQSDKDTITSLQIINTNKDLMINQPLKIYADDLVYKDVFPVVYHPGNEAETIILNIYMDDFDIDNAKELIEYIGLSEEFSDYKLTLTEIRESETFKYKDILNLGEYQEHFYAALE